VADRGYLLAIGDRDYVLVDLYGIPHSVPRMIRKIHPHPTGTPVRGRDFPKDSLATVEEAQELVAGHRELIDPFTEDSNIAAERAALEHAHRERRGALETGRKRPGRIGRSTSAMCTRPNSAGTGISYAPLIPPR
jgi:hypothetical protein